jgi:stage V sporulation protein D (sporulation-specific penicillin-binding protein)
MLGRTDSRLRLVALLSAFAILATLLGVRLAYWQLGQGPDLRRIAAQQVEQPQTADEVRRGDITDRRGNVLATTAYRDQLAAYPDEMISDTQRDQTASGLATILGFNAQQEAALRASFGSDQQPAGSADAPVPYVVVDKQLTETQSDQVRAGLASGALAQLGLEPHPMRFYPSAGGSPGTTLASQLLGFVTQDGQGRYGVEQSSQSILAGAGSATADAGDSAPLPQTGGSVQLTIDAGLQLRLEKELYAAWVADRAPRVTGVVMDPYTGAILAWGSVPGYDENDYASVAADSPDLFTDPIASQVYEPGSVMKMFTAAAALDKGVIGLTTPVQDQKKLVFGSSIVQNFDKKSIGIVPFQDAIADSRNVVASKVAMMLGNSTDAASSVLYDMWQRLGIGEPTGIELNNESAGLVTDPSVTPWQPIDLANHSFGQGVAVTPLQLVRAFAAMANGGLLVQPHIYTADDAEAEANVQQAIPPQLSDTLRQLMIHVVDAGPGYAAQTKIPGYVVGGKTGTAQIWDPQSGGWLPDTYNHTFVGFVGNDKPEAIILVRIHDTIPRVPVSWGMTLEMTSNELWRRVALDAISTLDLQPLPGFDPSQVADPYAPPTDPTDPTTPTGQPADTPTPMPTGVRPAGAGSGTR